jgi:hypothetical protein
MSSTSTVATNCIVNLIIQKFPLKITPALEKKMLLLLLPGEAEELGSLCIYLNIKPLSDSKLMMLFYWIYHLELRC